MRILISGASGLIGSELRRTLIAGGHFVQAMVRKPLAQQTGDVFWNPAVGEIDAAAMEGFDAVVHLSGENITNGRWTTARKRRFVSSRVDSTRLLSETLARLQQKPRVLVAASAIGFYGNRGDEWVDESSAPGTGFLADLCRAWEEAASPAVGAGIRVVHPRIGLVFSAAGGPLPAMRRVFRFGIGGVIGSGKQYISWIAIDDLIKVICEAIANDSLSGSVNAVAPSPVTNRELTKTLAAVLHRPSFLPMPALAVKLLLGEMGQSLLLEGVRVAPAKLQKAGFQFALPKLEEALRACLSRN